ncbi:MAG: M28 family peptidase [Ferruginibacter sp.]
MKKIFVVTVLLFEMAAACAQTDDASKYASVITAADLQKHLTIIASDEMEGRETGTDGQRKAATYIESQFKAIGLQIPTGMTGYQQFYPLHKDTMLSSSLKIADYTAEYGTDYIIPRANASGTFTSNDIVFAGYGIEDEKYNDYTGLNVTGKLVIIFLGEPKSDGIFLISGKSSGSDWTYPGLSKKITLSANKGAAGVLVINPSTENFSKRSIEDSKHSNIYYPAESNGIEDKNVNFALITHQFAKTLFADRFDAIIKKAKASEPFSQSDAWNKNESSSYGYEKKTKIIYASNVLGMIEGTDKKDEYVFLSAHYDHLGKHDGKIYYGADDDGSGTVGVIEMATAFAKAKAEGKGPRRTLIFMTVSGEEKGLWGSQYYSDHPIFPLDKTSVDLNTDMVGRIDTERKTADTTNYVYVVGHDKISSDLPVINEAVNNKYTLLKLDYKFDDPKDPERIYYRSDHYNFARKGVPVLFFYDGMLKADYHKPTDTVEKINWALYEKRVRMIFYTAWEIANRKKMLKRNKPLPSETR